MPQIKFYTTKPVTATGVTSTKVHGYRYGRHLPLAETKTDGLPYLYPEVFQVNDNWSIIGNDTYEYNTIGINSSASSILIKTDGLQVGETYTISIRVKDSEKPTGAWGYLDFREPSVGILITWFDTRFSFPSINDRLEHTFTWQGTTLGIYGSSVTTGFRIVLDDIRIKKVSDNNIIYKNSIESKISFPECPAVRQANLVPNTDYDILQLTEANRQLLANVTDKPNHTKDIILYSHEDRDYINKGLHYTKGLKQYNDYFNGSIPYEAQSQFSLAFNAAGAHANGNDIGVGFINFKDKYLNNISATFSRLTEATYIDENGVMQTAPINTPRIDWSNGKPELLIERESENLRIESSVFSNFSKTRCTITDNQGVFLNGNQEAAIYTITDLSGSNLHFANYSQSLTANQTYTLSGFVKDINHGNNNVILRELSNFANISFNFQTKVVSSSGSWLDNARVDEYPDGWYRLILTFTPDVNTVRSLGWTTFQSTGLNSFYIAGLQFEEGLNATSYIPTNGTPVTRDKDLPILQTSLLNPLEGSMYIDGEFYAVETGDTNAISLSTNTASNRFSLYNVDNGEFWTDVVVSGVGALVSGRSGIVNGSTNNGILSSYKLNDFKSYENGELSKTSNMSNTFSELTHLRFDLGSSTGTKPFNGRLSTLVYIPKAIEISEGIKITK